MNETTEVRKPTAKISQAQVKHIKERMETVLRSITSFHRSDRYTKEPPEVKAARKTIDRWETKLHTEGSQRRQQLKKLTATIEEQILFGDPQKALRSVQVLEKHYANEIAAYLKRS